MILKENLLQMLKLIHGYQPEGCSDDMEGTRTKSYLSDIAVESLQIFIHKCYFSTYFLLQCSITRLRVAIFYIPDVGKRDTLQVPPTPNDPSNLIPVILFPLNFTKFGYGILIFERK